MRGRGLCFAPVHCLGGRLIKEASSEHQLAYQAPGTSAAPTRTLLRSALQEQQIDRPLTPTVSPRS